MAGALGKIFGKIFGNKADKDFKELSPFVGKINEEYNKLQSLTNYELRNKTSTFKALIKESLSEITQNMNDLKEKADQPEVDVNEKEDLYKEVEKLEKDRLTLLEEVLLELLPQAFAVMKETSRRFSENETLEVTAQDFDKELSTKKDFVSIQGDKAFWKNSWLIGGTVLHKGKIAEMATGEGKTLVSTLPAYLNALAGFGVHIVTVNDYLARRDSEWNGPLFQFHGLAVDCIDLHPSNSDARRKAYQADIIYGTNNEFGFDYLRDNMATSKEDIVQGHLHYAMVDEVDSVLIDDARTPLIISGPIPKGDEQEFYELKPRIEKVVEAQKRYLNTCLVDAKKFWEQNKQDQAAMPMIRCYRGMPKNKAFIKFMGEAGVKQFLLKTEGFYMQDNYKEMPKVDVELYYVIDEKNNNCELTDKGIEAITASGEDKQFFILPDVGSIIAEIEKSTDTHEQKVHQKEEVLLQFSNKSERIHTINQLLKAYNMFERDVEYIIEEGKIKIVDEQTGRVLDGRRYSDGLHQAIEAKENVKVEDATQTFATITLQNYFRMYHKLAGMTGTAETEASELWEIYKLDVVVIPTNKPTSRADKNDKVYKTRRAKFKAVIDEIERLRNEGRPILVGTTSVEISEQLSRMLQIKKVPHNVLNAKQHQREAEIVQMAGQVGQVTIATNMAGRGTDIKLTDETKKSGGLAIIGTERHESRRVDRQLRGRSGRQGDPGTSQFFVSLEDDLMRLFGSDRMSRVMDRFNIPEDEVIENGIITRQIEGSQKKVEQNNFGSRKHLLEYDDVMNNQRNVVYTKRRNALFGDKLAIDIVESIYTFCGDLVDEYKPANNFDGFEMELLTLLATEPNFDAAFFGNNKAETITEKLYDHLSEIYKNHAEQIATQSYPTIKQVYEDRGQQYENILVPFSDGTKSVNVIAPLRKSYETQGKEVFLSFEKMVMLSFIDDAWKEHLRDLDDLKQAVRNAHLEQKDPLLIYKLESFKLFNLMMAKINKNVLPMFFRGHIESNSNQPQVSNAPARRSSNLNKLKLSRESDIPQLQTPQDVNPTGAEHEKAAPIKVGPKVGRNDACPCGSGKKFKNCHGKEND
ncbi:MAG: preprotein translocase subunit SecA [Bacteroidetes bacterium]|nr:preprotein translocase subunit SecA [Bacteroidota bacterium]